MIGSLHSATRFAPGIRSSRSDFQWVNRAGRPQTRRCTARSALDVRFKDGVVKARPPVPKYATVLSMDGGGVRGLVPLIVLEAVEEAIIDYIKENEPELVEDGKKIEVDMADYFDVISGTSVGSVVALYLASRGGECGELLEKYGLRAGSVKGMIKLITERGKDVFLESWHSWIALVAPLLYWIKKIFVPKFEGKGMEKVLKEMFGKMTLEHVDTGVVVPAFELTGKQAFSFWSTGKKNGEVITGYAATDPRPAKANQKKRQPNDLDIKFSTANCKLWEVAKASCSAPTFFPASTFGPFGKDKEKTFIDGGVIANNPTLQAIVFTQRQVACKTNMSQPPPHPLL